MQYVWGLGIGFPGEVNDRQATIDPFFLRNEPYCPRVIRSAYDAVDGSHHRHRSVPKRGCCYKAGDVRSWLRLLKNSVEKVIRL